MPSSTEDNLTQVEAQQRGALINDVSYHLHLVLPKGSTEYTGELTLRFKHKDHSKGTFLDLITKKIEKLNINGKSVEVTEQVHKDNRVHLAGEHLVDGDNTVSINYTNLFDTNGNGLHRFVDPIDQQEYVYTMFEPFYAHRMIPCFDQPDIKAKLKLIVTAPSDWEVVANSGSESAVASGSNTVHTFAETPLLSTYLYALVAGPYHIFREQFKYTRHSGEATEVPLGLLCRKSLSKYLDTEELFTITKQGLQFYVEFFGCDYPFSKYDQIFVPEFNMGAMENPGCVTFTENYVFRDPPTDMQRLRRCDTVLHEMAHMWFGDLVSPIWWDGLWLNESFATYMAALAVAQSTRFGSASWLEFNLSMKRWAYREDQLTTTHPIQGDVVDTNSTFQNFDGITYGKGASVLKQLVAVAGLEDFRDGMRHYFKIHAWKNTTISDFLRAIEHGTKKDLRQWARLWLETAGLNTLEPVWSTTADGKIGSFHIEQTAPEEHPTLRPHQLEVAIFDFRADTNEVVLRQVVPVQVNGPKTEVPALVQQAAPAAVFLNYNDHAYCKTNMDQQSLKFVMAHLEKFPDPLLRQLLWNTFVNMMRDYKMPATQFLKLVKDKVPEEKDARLVQMLVRSCSGALNWWVPDELKEREYHAFFELSWDMLFKSHGADERITWARSAIDAARTVADIQKLLGLMDKGTGLEGFELDQDMRWSLINRAAAYGLEGWEKRLEEEEKRDATDKGKRAIASAKASVPNFDVKNQTWDRVLNDKESSLFTLSATMSGINQWHQKDLLKPFVGKFFDIVLEVFRTRTVEFAQHFFDYLYPHYRVDDEVLSLTQSVLDKTTDSDAILRRTLKEAIDDLKRAKACHELVRKTEQQ